MNSRPSVGAFGEGVASIHQQLQAHGFEIAPGEVDRQFFGPGTRSALQRFQTDRGLPPTGALDESTAAALAGAPTPRTDGPSVAFAVLNQLGGASAGIQPPVEPPNGSSGESPSGEASIIVLTSTVSGSILFDNGLPAPGIPVRLYAIGFGDKETRLAEGETDGQGRYSLSYRSVQTGLNLQVWTVDAQGKEVPLSATIYGAGAQETLNLVAPSTIRPAVPEFTWLAADLGQQVGQIEALAGAREDDERQDLSVLYAATRWDARLITLLSHAASLATTTGLSQESLYALLRAGLPSDPQQLATLDPETIELGLKAARDVGVVSLDDGQIARSKAAFASFAATTRPAMTAPGTLSTFGDLLNAAGVQEEHRSPFLDVYFSQQDGGQALWEQAAKSGVPQPQIAALQIQGKLVSLTHNLQVAAALSAQLQTSDNLAALADAGLYASDAWKAHLAGLATPAGQGVDALVPPSYTGDTPEERLDAYAADLARRVRRSFPTRVVARMLEAGELKPTTGVDPVETATLLRSAESLGFRLGQMPVQTFVRDNQARLFPSGATPEQIAAGTEALQQMQRGFQITPSGGSLKTVLDLGFTSAHDVVAFGFEEFLERFGDQFPSRGEAELVYRKSQQVSNVAYSFFTAAQQLDTAPPMYAISPPEARRQEAKANLIKTFPTLETLFGSLDFCACEECGSVLGAAAYLVDLLQLLDPSALKWQSFLQDWTIRHNGAPYPFADSASRQEYLTVWRAAHPGQPDPDTEKTPYEVLIGRRPDLPLLPLTCENTNTVLPHIDIVNEILEYFVARGKLDDGSVRDTGEATSADLLAEPQNIIPEAYDKLRQARYPTTLPFDLWLATVRGFCSYFDTPFWQVLETFRPTDDLFASPASPRRYDRAAIFAEMLGLTPDQYALFTAANPLADWFALYGYPSEDEAMAALRSAKTLARRLHLSYQQVADLVRTGFVNLVLADPDAGCDFDQAALGYADGRPADAIAFLKINLFVRLWQILGWSMEETDRALQAFLPAGARPLTGANLGGAFTSALLYLAHLKVLDARLQVGAGSRIKLLTFWSDLTTSGENSLYAQLFLTRHVLETDPVFDDPQGNYLSNPAEKLKDHLLTVQGAVGLTAREIGEILQDAGLDLDTAPLSLGTLSLLYRHALLARALHLPVADLLTLKGLSGLDPFTPLKPDGVGSLDDDFPFTRSLRFLDVVESVKGSGFTVEDLDYLLRHRYDPVGVYRPNPDALLQLVRTLAGGLGRIQAQYAVPADAAALTDDVLRQDLSLALPVDVVDTVFGMWNGTIVYEAAQNGVAPASALDAADLAADPDLSVSYDAVLQAQKLSFRGVPLPARVGQLTTAHPSPLLAELLADVQGQAKSFFDKQLSAFLAAGDFETLFTPIPDTLPDEQKQAQLGAKRERLASGFLPFLQRWLSGQLVVQIMAAARSADPSLVEALLTDAALLSDPTQTGSPLVAAFEASAQRGVSAAFFSSADGSGSVVGASTAPSATTDGKPAGANSARFEGYFEVPQAGPYRFSAVCGKAGAVVSLQLDGQPDPVLSGTASVDGAAISGVTALKPGTLYGFTLEVGSLSGGDVTVLVQGETMPQDALSQLTLYPRDAVERVRRADVLLAKALQLISGLALDEREVRYLITHGADFDGLSLSQLPIAATDGTSAQAAAPFTAFLRLAGYVALRADVAGGTDDLIDIFENARRTFPASTPADQAGVALLTDLTQRFAALTRRDPSVVQAAATQLGFAPQSTSADGMLRIEAPQLAQERGVGRLWQALQMVETLGISVASIAAWATPDPDISVAAALRNSVKAHYDQESWQRIAQAVFDPLRQQKRDALAGYIMAQQGFDRPEQLFESFLVDTGMEPVVQTSRLVLALASLQTFIQRCLLNLDPEVHPSALNAQQWEWMKRYRVWQANRRIFLYPENWLEPEFRDDKTSLYTELESALLQGDISEDLAEDAFFTYLRGLEAIARLEIVTMYCEESPLDPGSNVLHVIGRTHSLPHKYFYRRYAFGAWTPWQPVTAEVEGEHIAVVVWRHRVHLFWVTFLSNPTSAPGGGGQQTGGPTLANVTLDVLTSALSASLVQQVNVQLHWSELFQGQWTIRESSGLGTPLTAAVPDDFDPSQVFIHVTKEYDAGEEGALLIHLTHPINGGFRVVNKNSPPQPLVRSDTWTNVTNAGGGTAVARFAIGPPAPDTAPEIPYPADRGASATRYDGDAPLQVSYVEEIRTVDGGPELRVQTVREILNTGGPFSLLTCDNQLQLMDAEIGALVAPFFYQDDQNAFFVEPTLQERTIEEWTEWVIPPPLLPPNWRDPTWWKSAPIASAIPDTPVPSDPIDPRARFAIASRLDWTTDPATALLFGNRLIGRTGALDGAGLPHGGLLGGGLVAGGVTVAGNGRPKVVGAAGIRTGLTVVAGGGLSAATLGRLSAHTSAAATVAGAAGPAAGHDPMTRSF